MLPEACGEGVATVGPPIFCRRDFRSILGFLSSAIGAARPYVPERSNVNEPSGVTAAVPNIGG